MPYSITTKDGITLQNIPDDITPDSPALKERVAKIRAGAQAAVPEATTMQKVQSSMPGRVLQGMRDPIDGAAQLLPRGLSAVTSLGGLAPNAVSKFFDDEAKRVDKINTTNEADYQQARKATQPRTMSSMLAPPEEPGFDGARLVGNVISPANAAIAARMPTAATTLGRIGAGALGGAVGAGITPVDMKDGTDFATSKAAQVGLGGTVGGVLGPVAGKVGDAVGKWVAGRAKPQPTIDDVMMVARQVAEESGTRWESMTREVQAELAGQVKQAMVNGAGRNPAALARQADFKAEGMKGTLGQITRDARQFANERNLRQLPGTGDPLLNTFENQGRQLTEKVGKFAAGAQPKYQAGTLLEGSLKGVDDNLSKGVRAAYQQARASSGKEEVLPLTGLAQDAADVIDRFADKVPGGVVNQLKKYGILPDQAAQSAPRKLFTVEAVDDLLKVINSSGSRTDDATNTALAQLRAAVKKTVTDGGADDVFAPARKLAAQRFALHEAVPALEASAKGTTAADDFVNRFIINGKTDEVSGMAKLLKTNAPEAYGQAKAQIGDKLREAAFGQNVAGDKAFSVERYAKALKDLGPDKLKAFFSADEISQLERLGRIGAYMNQFPNSAPVNTSNNWGAITSLAGRIPGISTAVNVAGAAKTAVGNTTAVSKAIAGEAPKVPPKFNPEDVRKISQLLSLGAAGAGAAAAQPLK